MSKVPFRPIFLVVLILLTFSLRFDVVDERSITQDESTMVLFARGVVERGYPFLRQSTGEFIISTYELVPYPIAISIALFGESEMAIRMPAVIFSCITAYLIFLMGERLHSRSVAVIAALSYAILPWSIYWGSNAFYPAQLQCFSVLTILILHHILTAHAPKPGPYYFVAASILAMYFSWEGSGFLLPVFFVTAIMLTWGEWRWLKIVDAWVAAFIIIFAVVAQLGFRTVLRAPFTALGSSRQDVTFLTPAYEAYSFNPTYYLTELASVNHFLMMALFIAGLGLIRRHWNLAFLYLVVIGALFFLSNLLGYYSLRYVYFLLPHMVLIAAITGVIYGDKLIAYINSVGFSWCIPGYTSLLLLIMLHFLISSPWGIQQWNDRYSQKVTPFELNYVSRGFSFKEVALELKRSYEEGDIVIMQAPFPISIYTGITGDFFLQLGTATTLFYHPSGEPYYRDKWVQNPVLRSRQALEEVLYSAPRVWFVFAPEGGSRSSVSRDLFTFIENNTSIVKEAHGGKLLLWENPYVRL